MCEVVPDCLVVGYEHLIDGLDLPDPDDRHVLAAAIRAHAQAIVTFNLPQWTPKSGHHSTPQNRPPWMAC